MKSASPDITIEFGPGGSPMTDISQWVVSDIPLGGEGIYIDGTPFKATSTVNEPVGVDNQPDITLEMFFDDEDDGPMDLFGTLSDRNTANYTLRVTWTPGSPATYSEWPCAIKANPIVGKVKDVTRMRVVLTSKGPVVHHRQGA